MLQMAGQRMKGDSWGVPAQSDSTHLSLASYCSSSSQYAVTRKVVAQASLPFADGGTPEHRKGSQSTLPAGSA